MGMARSAGLPWRAPLGISERVYQCINSSSYAGVSPQDCLDKEYLGLERNRKREDYFVYEEIPTIGGSYGTDESLYTDACMAHSGPAAMLSKPNQFQDCLDDNEEQCNIPQFIWSGRSEAKMPVASYHSWSYDSRAVNAMSIRYQRSREMLAKISQDLVTKIKAVNDTFLNQNINVEIFSAEGTFYTHFHVFFMRFPTNSLHFQAMHFIN